MENMVDGECRVAPVVVESTGAGRRIADFHQLLGDAAWLRLPPAVRQRFAYCSHVTPTFYRGAMRVEASFLGRCFAHVCRFIGTPVAPFTGESVPVDVRVQDLADHSGTVWERCYRFPGRPASIVRSVKQLDDDGSLVERLGAGLHMKLAVREIDGALYFISSGYFFRLGPLRIDLPQLFPPGMTRVAHIDKGNGRFQFTMRTAHPWFGEMFVQDGEFE